MVHKKHPSKMQLHEYTNVECRRTFLFSSNSEGDKESEEERKKSSHRISAFRLMFQRK